MISRRKIFWTLVLLFLLGAAFLFFRPNRAAQTGLLASKPMFGHRSNAGRTEPVISILVSNPGLNTVSFDIPWLECRVPSGLSFASPKLVPVGAAARSILLSPNHATNLVIAIEDAQGDAAQSLFCCHISWREDRAAVQNATRPIDNAMWWLGAWLGFNWNSPLSRIRPAYGDAFVSNVDVADYFSRTWGFTRDRLLKAKLRNQRLQARQEEELALIQASLPPNSTVRFGTAGQPFTDQERTRFAARNAFEQFCRISANMPESAAPGPAAGQSQPFSPETNRTSGEAGSRR